jgi:spore coat polysaccharide biosynthesis protein SpsF
VEQPVVAIIQARMGSTRLPGKSVAEVNGKPLLALMVERVREARAIDAVVVATTEAGADDRVAEIATGAGADVFRGSEQDVLARYVGAAAQASAGTVVRLTADCPLLAPEVIDHVVAEYERAGADLVTNAPLEGRTYPDGMEVEVFSVATLAKADAAAVEPSDREHVTLVMKRPPFSMHVVHHTPDLGAVRITIDHPEDLERVRGVYEKLAPRHPRFTMDDVIAALRDGPSGTGLAQEEFWKDEYLAGVELPVRPDMSFPFERALSDALAAHAPARPGESVLEVGCAPAKWLAFYAERFGARVTGIEYTDGGAQLSRANLSALGIPGEIRRADFFDTPATPADVVLSLGFIEHFDDLEAVFARHLDFLGPGGRLVIGVPNYRGLLGQVQRWANPAHLAMHNVAAMEPALYERLAARHGLALEWQGHLNGPDPIIIKWGRRSAVPAIRALQVIRRLPGSGRVNPPWASSYLLTVLRRSGSGS